MLSPTDGWIVGAQQNAYPGATASDYQQHTILLGYQSGQWRQAQAPNTGTPVDAITGLAYVRLIPTQVQSLGYALRTRNPSGAVRRRLQCRGGILQ